MKDLYLLFILVLVAENSYSQVITIPNANFKAKLIQAAPTNGIAKDLNGNYFKIDVNNNSEIEISEAEQVSYLNISFSSISDLNGISAFTNLVHLYNEYNYVSSLNLNGLLHLKNLYTKGNLLTALSMVGCTELQYLNCDDNALTELNCEGLSNLERVYCQQNQLISLNLNGCSSMWYLNCEDNYLTALDISQIPNIIQFRASYNDFVFLDFSQNQSLNWLELENNSLTSLILKNGSPVGTMMISGNDQLTYLCANEADIPWIQNTIDYHGMTNCVVNSYCSFAPGGTYYTISGIVRFDGNTDGCDAADTATPHIKFNISNGSATGTFIANDTGTFDMPVQQGTHTITPIIQNPSYFTISPASVSISFPATASPFTQNFCIAPNGIHHDVSVVAMPSGPAVPGFDAHYWYKITNTGNQIASGAVNFNYDESVLDFVSATGGAATLSPGQVSIPYSNIQPLASQIFYTTLNLNSPMESPALNQDDILQFSVTAINSAAEETPLNNTMAFSQTVVNSMDPNHKTCVEGATIPPSMVGEYVHYIIEFENVGTFPATNVVVKDMIDTNKFDVSTLVPVASSHSYTTRITETNKVEFIFEGINLPFDDANNDGFIAFKIKTKPTLIVGNAFSNTSSIYFDYNFPIVTNTATTTIAALANPDFDFRNFFSIYPNPASDRLNISKTAEIAVTSICVYNLLGQQLIVIPNGRDIDAVDVSTLQTGTYFLKINSDSGSSSAKFIKQ
ncbi:MAG TPA: T9SS type A sorting domain-containing protein [Flavobacterium sp.]|jgi:hypothetical protein